MTTEADLKRIVEKLERKMSEAKSFQEQLAHRIQKIDKEISQLKARKKPSKEKP